MNAQRDEGSSSLWPIVLVGVPIAVFLIAGSIMLRDRRMTEQREDSTAVQRVDTPIDAPRDVVAVHDEPRRLTKQFGASPYNSPAAAPLQTAAADALRADPAAQAPDDQDNAVSATPPDAYEKKLPLLVRFELEPGGSRQDAVITSSAPVPIKVVMAVENDTTGKNVQIRFNLSPGLSKTFGSDATLDGGSLDLQSGDQLVLQSSPYQAVRKRVP